MRVTFRAGWESFVADLSGAELEILQRIAGKSQQCQQRWISAVEKGGDSRAVLVVATKRGKTIPADFGLEIVSPQVEEISKNEFEALEAQAAVVSAEAKMNEKEAAS